MLVEKVMLPEKINMPGWIIVIIVIGVILGTVFWITIFVFIIKCLASWKKANDSIVRQHKQEHNCQCENKNI